MPATEVLELARGRLAGGDLGGALAQLERAMAEAPLDPRVHVLHGRLLRMQGRHEESARALDRARELDPADSEASVEKAALALEQRDFAGATALLSGVLGRDPANARAHFELGRLHRMRGEFVAAIACQRAAIAADPRLVDAYCELGWMLNERREPDQALEVYERALAVDPENITVNHNLGMTLGKLEHYERALEILEKLCARLPGDYSPSWLNLATALAANGEVRRAAEVYERILAVEPNNVYAHWNRSHFLLAERQYEDGWRDYAWRFMVDGLGLPRLIPHPPWGGEALEGRSILVSSEQGLGDQIMFASCLPEVIERAGSVVIECRDRLEALFRRSFPRARVIGSQLQQDPPWLKEVGEVDFHASMGSLPALLRNRAADFPAHRGYLKADPARVEHWRARLAALGPGLKVGLSWRGGTHATRRRLRSLELADLQPLLEQPGCHFVSLQYGDCASELDAIRRERGIPVAHWQEAIDDYDETAALCGALDLTISVCTSVIHLNGALGRPVWIMVPSAPEWRYGFAGERMDWYPSARLYRQAERSSWAPVLAQIGADLARLRAG